MDAPVEVDLDFVVAIPARHRLEGLVVGEILDIGVLMAFHAFEPLVDRRGEERLIHEERDCSALSLFRKGLVGVTFEARRLVGGPGAKTRVENEPEREKG
jgi:hypothetical protein